MKNKFLLALLSAVIGFGLWVYVVTEVRPESEVPFYNVPVVLDGTEILQDKGLMITSDTDLTVTLRLYGNRSELSSLKNSDLAAVVDLSRINEAGEKKLTYTVSIPGNKLVDVTYRSPDTIPLTITEWASKEVPVKLAYIGSVPEGYSVDKQNATVDVQAVTVTGPVDIIDQIEMAKITVDLGGRTETFREDLRYSLCDGNGNPIKDVSTVTTNHAQIRTTVGIQMLKDLKLTYEVVPGGGLTESDVSILLDCDTITVAGSPAVLERYDEISLGTIDLGAITDTTQLLFTIKLPEGVDKHYGPAEVSAQVTLPQLETREYTVTNFETINAPPGVVVKISEPHLSVKIRGRGPVLDRIESDDIVAIVDLVDEQIGTSIVNAVIQVRGLEAGEDVGAVEKYEVTVTLSAKTLEPPAPTDSPAA